MPHKNNKNKSGKLLVLSRKKINKNLLITSKQNSVIKMTDKQRLMFTKKLANLPVLGSYAPVGASTDDYANKIADELLDPTKSGFYLPFLEVVGFKYGINTH